MERTVCSASYESNAPKVTDGRSPWYRTQGMVFPDGVLGKWLGYRTLDRVCPVILLGNSTWYLTQDGVCPDSTAPMTEYAPIVPHP